LQTQQDLLLDLQNKSIYPHKISPDGIRVLETHISYIFLTGPYAYKIKKAVKFGRILDFSTVGRRKKYCRAEIGVNKLLCKKMYLGIVKIVKERKTLKLVRPDHNSRAIEYAVKMMEIPQKYRMDIAIRLKTVDEEAIDNLAQEISRFHFVTPTNKEITAYGTPGSMKIKIDENFRTLRKLDDNKQFNRFHSKLKSFVSDNRNLFYDRMSEKKIRNIHGDLYLKNIFMMTSKKFYLYDRIEFNDSLRFADVAEDIAHLSMDLDFVQRSRLRKVFVCKYLEITNDRTLESLLYFLMCYKACVRAKVALFRADTERMSKVKHLHIMESNHFSTLAGSYLSKF
jgi:aminoglycoside phosphotransferase family enzyme